ncbi:F-box domain containing protein [Tanacetum coccineum]|uniref:F-box domain containing protein n=1 Tax=Tanacetum coccineum TaxID=301880 RepID=A0ABQ5AWC8_9ASTR
MKKENVIIKDRISELPEFIIDKILLGLDSSKERVRVSVLSKRWCALTTSFPYMHFNFDEFVNGVYGTRYHRVARYLFYKYVEHSVSRFFRQQNLKSVHTFKLSTLFQDDKEVGIINKCLELILQKGVKVLDIDIAGNTQNLQTYCLPIGPSSSVSKLTSLKMSRIVLPLSLLNNDDVAAFKSLKVLPFNLVSLDPRVIERLIVSCRLLEVLTVEFCSGMKKFHVGRLQNLKKLWFRDNDGVEEIDIKAPNLSECHLFLNTWKGKGAPYMNLGSCQQLRTLHLAGSPFLTSKELSDFLSNSLKKSNFPFLENLSLCLRNRQDNPEVSSPLRKPVLDTKGTRSQPYELVHFQLELETIKELSVMDAVLFFCRPRSLSVVSNFYSINYKEQSRVVKNAYKCIISGREHQEHQQEHQVHTGIRIHWFDAECRLNSLPTFSDDQLRETITFIKEEAVQGMQMLRLFELRNPWVLMELVKLKNVMGRSVQH